MGFISWSFPSTPFQRIGGSPLQGVAADGAVSALRKNAKTPAAPVFATRFPVILYPFLPSSKAN